MWVRLLLVGRWRLADDGGLGECGAHESGQRNGAKGFIDSGHLYESSPTADCINVNPAGKLWFWSVVGWRIVGDRRWPILLFAG